MTRFRSPLRSALRYLIAAALCWTVAAVADAPQSADAAGLHSDTVFTEYSPLSRTSELVRRLFSPLQAQRAIAAIAAAHGQVREQAIDLRNERFTVYVPPTMPADGYGLLVFVPPWNDARVPDGWTGVFDAHGLVFVSAAHSGNDASVLDRREPLALLAAYNAMQRFHIDPQRVFVGGFSGGSRVAMRLALAFPDLFRGALLNAGSDPIGTGGIVLPPQDLMQRFQESTRLVYLTGKDDAPRREMDAASQRSMTRWCVFDVQSVPIAWTGHEVPNATALERGVAALGSHAPADADKLAACRTDYTDEMDKNLDEIARLSADGRDDRAKPLLEKTDEKFGGLSAPRIIELARTIEAAAAASDRR
jgi:poly(3-hydroxybutyrate) depolymerase